jgi:hypothetical protein
MFGAKSKMHFWHVNHGWLEIKKSSCSNLFGKIKFARTVRASKWYLEGNRELMAGGKVKKCIYCKSQLIGKNHHGLVSKDQIARTVRESKPYLEGNRELTFGATGGHHRCTNGFRRRTYAQIIGDSCYHICKITHPPLSWQVFRSIKFLQNTPYDSRYLLSVLFIFHISR